MNKTKTFSFGHSIQIIEIAGKFFFALQINRVVCIYMWTFIFFVLFYFLYNVLLKFSIAIFISLKLSVVVSVIVPPNPKCINRYSILLFGLVTFNGRFLNV